MATFLVVIHVIVCLTVVIVVLLQVGKGADIGSAFGGGGSQTLFGSRGAGSFLTKLTAVAGALFMITSLTLAMVSSKSTGSSVVHEEPAQKGAMPAMPPSAPFNPQAPAQNAPAGAPAQGSPAMPPAPGK